jgi:filamentous hemagglutinin
VGGAVPAFGIVPDTIDFLFTAAEIPFGKSTTTDLGFAAAGLAGTFLPVLGDGPAAAAKIATRAARNADEALDAAEGMFSLTSRGWQGYPAGVPKPEGPFRLVEGAEYTRARAAANTANNQIRIAQGLRGQPVDVHEIQPVRFGGSPIDSANKIIIDRDIHRQQVTPWWNQLMQRLTGE